MINIENLNSQLQQLQISKQKLEYSYFIENDHENSLNILDELFKKFSNTKHKCNRNENCECIYFGKMIINIYLNLDTYTLSKKNLIIKNTNEVDLLKVLNIYFINPDINLPYEMFKELVNCLLKQLDFNSARSLIENYLTYSVLIKNPLENKNKNKKMYEINYSIYEELHEILIFKIILITSGFSRARSKTQSIPDENLKNKFSEKLIKIYLEYKKNGHWDEIEKSEVNEIINDIIDSKIDKKFSFKTSFSSFFIKNSIIQKIYLIIINKKFIILLTLVAIITTLYKLVKRYNLDNKIRVLLTVLLVYLNKFKLFNAFYSLITGIFKLLVNY